MARGSPGMNVLHGVALSVIASVFAISGLLKLASPHDFARTIGGYPGISPTLAVALAYYLPWLELIIAAALAAKTTRRGGVFLVSLLGFVFSFVLGAHAALGLNTDCGCFGAATGNQDPLLGIMRNIAIVSVGIWLLRKEAAARILPKAV